MWVKWRCGSWVWQREVGGGSSSVEVGCGEVGYDEVGRDKVGRSEVGHGLMAKVSGF